MLTLYNGDRKPQLRPPDGRNIAPRPRTNHDQIKGFRSHYATSQHVLKFSLVVNYLASVSNSENSDPGSNCLTRIYVSVRRV